MLAKISGIVILVGYDQGGLTNNNTNNNTANNANIQIEFRKQADKYTPTATNSYSESDFKWNCFRFGITRDLYCQQV